MTIEQRDHSSDAQVSTQNPGETPQRTRLILRSGPLRLFGSRLFSEETTRPAGDTTGPIKPVVTEQSPLQPQPDPYPWGIYSAAKRYLEGKLG